MAHHKHAHEANHNMAGLLIPFKDIFLLSILYGTAILFKKNVLIHAKAMIATGIVCLEPPLVRLVNYHIVPHPTAYPVTILVVYTVLLSAIIWERNHQSGKWIFPSLLIFYVFTHTIIIFRLPIPFLEAFAKWFINLPIT
jgi:Ca2+/Na+ antiporter